MDLTRVLEKVEEIYGKDETGSIQNRPLNMAFDDIDQLTKTPDMSGKNGTLALYEIHIFLAPLWIENKDIVDESLVNKYKKIVEIYNEVMKDKITNFKVMKDPVLVLKYKEYGYITVLQSSLYYLTNDKMEVIKMTHSLAELFKLSGFKVLREKVEISIHGVDGIPNSCEEMKNYSGYFEFHIRIIKKTDRDVAIKDKKPMSADEIKQLEYISETFELQFERPIPLSYNRNKNEINGGFQRYLNVRFRDIGVSKSIEKVNEIKQYIKNNTDFIVEKSIDEYIVYDTYVKLDRGWIDF
jgi:hypothetical protein